MARIELLEAKKVNNSGLKPEFKNGYSTKTRIQERIFHLYQRKRERFPYSSAYRFTFRKRLSEHKKR